jgi:hypothetical protein
MSRFERPGPLWPFTVGQERADDHGSRPLPKLRLVAALTERSRIDVLALWGGSYAPGDAEIPAATGKGLPGLDTAGVG